MLRDLNQLIGGKRICGTGYVGKLASEIPTGFALPSLLANDIDGADPVGCRYRMQVLTGPSVGTLVVGEAGDYVFTPPAPEYSGTVTGTQRVYKFDATHQLSADDTTYSFVYGAALTSVSSDLISTYAVLSQVQSDLAVAYSVASMTTTVSADLVAAYTMVSTVESDLQAAYSALNSVGAQLAAGYQIFEPVSSDLGAAYAVASFVTAVSSDLTAAYSVVTSVHADFAFMYSIYELVFEVSSDLDCSYAVRGQAEADLDLNYSIAALVSADLAGAYKVGDFTATIKKASPAFSFKFKAAVGNSTAGWS